MTGWHDTRRRAPKPIRARGRLGKRGRKGWREGIKHSETMGLPAATFKFTRCQKCFRFCSDWNNPSTSWRPLAIYGKPCACTYPQVKNGCEDGEDDPPGGWIVTLVSFPSEPYSRIFASSIIEATSPTLTALTFWSLSLSCKFTHTEVRFLPWFRPEIVEKPFHTLIFRPL